MARADAANRPSPARGLTSRQVFWAVVFMLLLAVGLAVLGISLFSPDWLRTEGDLPVGLRSPRKANYAMDPQQFSLPPVSEQILGEALADRADMAGTASPSSELATLMVALSSPVPSVTPLPGSTAVPIQPQSSPTVPPTATFWFLTTSTPPLLPTETAATPLPSATQPLFTAVPTRTYPAATVVPVSPTKTATHAPAATQPLPTQVATKTSEPTKPTKAAATATQKVTPTPGLTTSPAPAITPTRTFTPPPPAYPPPSTAYPLQMVPPASQ